MTKPFRTLTLLAACLLPLAPAHAELCYRLEPYLDVIRLAVPPGVDGHQLLYGKWQMPGAYAIPVTGSREGARVSIIGANYTKKYFTANVVCALTGTENSSWRVQCSGAAKNFLIDDTTTGSYPEFPTRLSVVSCAAPLTPRLVHGRNIAAVGSGRQ